MCVCANITYFMVYSGHTHALPDLVRTFGHYMNSFKTNLIVIIIIISSSIILILILIIINW